MGSVYLADDLHEMERLIFSENNNNKKKKKHNVVCYKFAWLRFGKVIFLCLQTKRI